MATLVSPGVAVSVVDESAYASVGTGTVPLIVIATGENKSDVSGTGTAAYTVKSEANKLKLITSQRELIQYYGEPYFEQVSGTSIHGGERNEYGLLTAYSYLGLANRAYVLRSDINLNELVSNNNEPAGPPNNNALWLDTESTSFGIAQADSDGNWISKNVTVLDNIQVIGIGSAAVPDPTVGSAGDFAIVVMDENGVSINPLKYYHKVNATDWIALDKTLLRASGEPAYATVDFHVRPHFYPPHSVSEYDIWVKSSEYNLGTNYSLKIYNENTDSFSELNVPMLKNDEYATQPGQFFNGSTAIARAIVDTGTGEVTSIVIDDAGSGYTQTPIIRLVEETDRNNVLVNTTATATISNGKVTAITLGGTAENSYFTQGSVVVEILGGAIPPANSIYLSYTSDHNPVFELKIFDGTSGNSTSLISGINAFNFTSNESPISGQNNDGTLWFNNAVGTSHIDLYENELGYWRPKTVSSVSASQPTGSVVGDVWIDTSDLDNFPVIKVYDGADWNLRDNTDQTTSNGVIFADITETYGDTTSAGVGATLLTNAPNPALYPEGMFAVNMCRSANTVRKYDTSLTTTWKWRNAAGNKADGSGFFGRKAVRKVIVQQLQSTVTSSDELRAETVSYNLISCPGYPELADELSTLNVDRKETAFVVVDTPYRTSPQQIVDWMLGTSAVENGEDGLVSPKNAGMAVYYPSALSTNLDGQTVLVPSSYVSLRTIAYSDSVSYPWFAPAGLTRGNVTNATNVGYLDTEEEFVPLALNEGQRDSLYTNKINPITNFPGTGIVVWGQKTLHPFNSALDRVNVSRLVAYLRERFMVLARPFIFEPNDELTRENLKNVLEGFLQDIMSKRGVYDFAVVCDESNNTPARIDRNELYADVAIEPTKAAEFIYIPVRLVNTGDL